MANSNGLSIDDVAMQLNRKFDEIMLRDQIDEKLGFARYTEGAERLGWLANLHEVGARMGARRLISSHVRFVLTLPLYLSL